jgi:hypothetical protein
LEESVATGYQTETGTVTPKSETGNFIVRKAMAVEPDGGDESEDAFALIEAAEPNRLVNMPQKATPVPKAFLRVVLGSPMAFSPLFVARNAGEVTPHRGRGEGATDNCENPSAFPARTTRTATNENMLVAQRTEPKKSI